MFPNISFASEINSEISIKPESLYQGEYIDLNFYINTSHDDLLTKYYLFDEKTKKELYLGQFDLDSTSVGFGSSLIADWKPGKYHFVIKTKDQEFESESFNLLNKESADEPKIDDIFINFKKIDYSERTNEDDYRLQFGASSNLNFNDLIMKGKLKCSEKIKFNYKNQSVFCDSKGLSFSGVSYIKEGYTFKSSDFDEKIKFSFSANLLNSKGVKLDSDSKVSYFDLNNLSEKKHNNEEVDIETLEKVVNLLRALDNKSSANNIIFVLQSLIQSLKDKQ